MTFAILEGGAKISRHAAQFNSSPKLKLFEKECRQVSRRLPCQANVCRAARNVPNQQRRRRVAPLLNSADAKRTGVSDRLFFNATNLHLARVPRAYCGAAIAFKQESQ